MAPQTANSVWCGCAKLNSALLLSSNNPENHMAGDLARITGAYPKPGAVRVRTLFVEPTLVYQIEHSSRLSASKIKRSPAAAAALSQTA